MPAPAPRRGWGMAVLALVVGLIVGAAIVGGVWWAQSGDTAAPPEPIPITADTLPDEVLGQQRDDLAMLASDEENVRERGKKLAKLNTSWIDAYRAAYGGPGIEATYGTVTGDLRFRLTIANGMQSLPVVTPDAVVQRVGVLGVASDVAAPGSTTTECVAQPTVAGQVVADGGIEAAREQVLDNPQSPVTCVRSDWSRNFSVQLSSIASGTDGMPPRSLAPKMAAEVDKIWESLTA